MVKKIKATKKIEPNAVTEYETKVHPGLKVFFGYNLYKAGLILRSILETKHLANYDLSASESGILYVLDTGAVVNQLTLGQELGIDKATIVKMIDKMEKMKIVKRDVDSTDRRSKLVSITSKGKTLLEKIRLSKNEVEKEVFSSFSKEEEAHLRALVPKFLEAIMNIKK